MRPARGQARPAAPAAGAGLQPHQHGRAGFRSARARGHRPPAAREGDAAFRGRQPRGRFREREPGPGLRPAVPGPGGVRRLAAEGHRAGPGPHGGVRLRPRALGQVQPGGHRRVHPAPGPGALRALQAGRRDPHRGRLHVDRPGPLRPPGRRAGRGPGREAPAPELHGLHHAAGPGHAGLRQQLHRRRVRPLRPERHRRGRLRGVGGRRPPAGGQGHAPERRRPHAPLGDPAPDVQPGTAVGHHGVRLRQDRRGADPGFRRRAGAAGR